MHKPNPTRIVRLVLNVTDLERSLAFYEGALDFVCARRWARGALLRLGDQEVEVIQHEGARPYPAARAANDPWFQHFAIAVADMGRAYNQLLAFGHEAISKGGPQQLPPSTGSVVAYKFRDPDGHPLELSYGPQSAWRRRDRGATGPFLGIDHTGIVVADLAAATAFYEALGFHRRAPGFNTGPEQDRLDGLQGVELDIGILAAEEGPHIELLCYRAPVWGGAPLAFEGDDVPSTRLVLNDALQDGGDAPGATIADPDGHRLTLEAPSADARA